MMKTVPALALLSGSLLAAGCQTAGGNLRQVNNGIRVPEAAPARERSEQQLAAGRAALQQRNYATAIAALREATLEPALAPAALNGLGVAYAGLGRNDLAEQYFRRAIGADPANRQYEENLARLYRAQLAADQVRREQALAREQAETQRRAAVRERQLAAGIRAAAPAQQLVAGNSGEVLLRTAAAEPAAQSAPQPLPEAVPVARLAVSTAVPGALIAARPVMQAEPGSEPAAPAAVVIVQRNPAVSAPGLRSNAPVALAASVPALGPASGPAPAAILVERPRDAVIAPAKDQPAPAVLAIASTGRIYTPQDRLGQSGDGSAPVERSAVRLASAKEIGGAIMRPMLARKLILGPLDGAPIGHGSLPGQE